VSYAAHRLGDDVWFDNADDLQEAEAESRHLQQSQSDQIEWRKVLDTKELLHAQELERLSAETSNTLQQLQEQHKKTLVAVTDEASEQARIAAQNHAHEKQELMQRLMDAAFEQQQRTHVVAVEAAKHHGLITAAVRLRALIEKIVLRQKSLAMKQWVLAIRSSAWASHGRKAAGSWFLQTSRARRKVRDIFQAWKTYTAISALGLDPEPLKSQAVVSPVSTGRLLRQLHAYFGQGGNGRLVRSQGGLGSSDPPQILLGMVFTGLTANQYQSLQPTLLESIYGSSVAARSAQLADKLLPTVATGHGEHQGTNQSFSHPISSSLPELYNLAKSKPWRQSASWGAVGASLAAEGRHVHDKEWQLKRRRTKEALNKRFAVNQVCTGAQISFEPCRAAGAVDEQPVRPVLSADLSTKPAYYSGLTRPSCRLGLGLRAGGNTAVLYTEAARVVAITRIQVWANRQTLQRLSCAWRQWIAAVNSSIASQQVLPIGLSVSSAVFSRLESRCSELEAAAEAATGQASSVRAQLEASQKEQALLEGITGDTLLQLADAQAEKALAEAESQQLRAAAKAAEAQMKGLQSQLTAAQEKNFKLVQQVKKLSMRPVVPEQHTQSVQAPSRQRGLNKRRSSASTLPKPNRSTVRGSDRFNDQVVAVEPSGFNERTARWMTRVAPGTASQIAAAPTRSSDDLETAAAGSMAAAHQEQRDPPRAATTLPASASVSASRRSSFSSMLKQLSSNKA